MTMSVPQLTTQLVPLLGLGVGADYALFIVSRHRQGLTAVAGRGQCAASWVSPVVRLASLVDVGHVLFGPGLELADRVQ